MKEITDMRAGKGKEGDNQLCFLGRCMLSLFQEMPGGRSFSSGEPDASKSGHIPMRVHAHMCVK